nr:hypothetical protein [Tanacetum cinerariifolium]
EREPKEVTSHAPLEDKSEKEEVEINSLYSNEKVTIGANLPLKIKEELKKLLRANQDIFAWTPSDMNGIPRELTEHTLNIHPCTFPIRQKKRVLAKERNDAINQEVIKLVKVQILKERRMMKNSFPHRAWDFCYEKMPFGLRNAGETYQRLVDKAFSNQLDRNIKIYVDDMVIKSRDIEGLITDIEETFHTLRRMNMKLNPKRMHKQEQFPMEPRNRVSIPKSQGTPAVSPRLDRTNTRQNVNTLPSSILRNDKFGTYGGKGRSWVRSRGLVEVAGVDLELRVFKEVGLWSLARKGGRG